MKGRRIIGESSSEIVCRNYGEQYINDAIADCFKIGYGYAVCPDCKVHKSIKIKTVMVNIEWNSITTINFNSWFPKRENLRNPKKTGDGFSDVMSFSY